MTRTPGNEPARIRPAIAWLKCTHNLRKRLLAKWDAPCADAAPRMGSAAVCAIPGSVHNGRQCAQYMMRPQINLGLESAHERCYTRIRIARDSQANRLPAGLNKPERLCCPLFIADDAPHRSWIGKERVRQGLDIPAAVPVIDYEGSHYQTDFWSGQGRDYEDAAERLALSRLLPATGRRVAEIGAGFGRLGEEYLGYEQIVLVDYSRTLLQEAAQRWGSEPRFVFAAGNIYQLPLASGVLDSLVMIRVMHHLADVPAALAQLTRVVHDRSTLVLEYANKRNVKALARWAARRQEWSPLSQQPVEFVELNFDFHPQWMAERMGDAGLVVNKRYAVSHFRVQELKRRVSAATLAQVDGALFRVGGLFPVSPSVFVQARAPYAGRRMEVGTRPDELGLIFSCSTCRHNGLERCAEDRMRCPACGAEYGRVQQVWDFKDRIA